MKKPKILFWDIETAPIEGYVWGLWENNLGLNQIKADWTILCWAAKWGDSSEVMYQDVSKQRDKRSDKAILKKLWKLLDEADIVVTQNGKKFDSKKANARFILNGFKPPSPYQHIDTMQLAKKRFAFTSNKLEYMTEKLNKKHRKLKHQAFGGFDLWKECLAGNKKAWKQMKDYNVADVLSLEELFGILAPWGTGVNFDAFHDGYHNVCSCGGSSYRKHGVAIRNAGRYQRYQCLNCGAVSVDKKNKLDKEKRASFRKEA